MMDPGLVSDFLAMICMSGEFDNIQSDENESQELDRLREEAVQTEVEGGNGSRM